MERYAGRYGLLKKLGEGGMGEVSLAVDLDSGAEVAIKRLTRSDGTADLDLLRGEFQALASVRHPAVVRVIELGTDFEGAPFLVMEYVVGWAADRVVQPGRIAELGFVAARVAGGLEAIHRANVVHGDLKPQNILVGAPEGDGRLRDVRIVDFGLSGRAGGGTAGYAAPEVQERIAGPSGDLYSFGATLYRLACGREPFEGDDNEKLQRQRSGPPSALPLEEAEVPEGWRRLILQLMATNPAERPRSAADVRRAIEQLAPLARVPLADRLRGETLVGRDAEIGRIEREWRRAKQGARSLVLTGEAGIGKSALLDAIAARAVLEQRSVVRVSGSSAGAGASWRAAARRIASEARVDLLAAASELRAALDDRAAEPSEEDLARVGAAMAGWCRAITERSGPPCVIVDDADALDAVSLRAMRRSMLAGPEAPAFWLLARRSDGSFADDQEKLMVDAGSASLLVLPPLARGEVERLAAARLGAEPTPELIEHLWHRAAGHPGLTVETLAATAAAGAVVEDEFGVRVDAAALAQVPLLPDFESTRLERIQALPEGARRTAQVLAAYGRPISLAALQRVDGGATQAGLEEMLDRGLAVRDPDDRWMLVPAALGVRLLEETSDEARAVLHRALLADPELSAREKFQHRVGAGDAAAALAGADEAYEESPSAELAVEIAAIAEPRDCVLAARWLTRAARALMDRGRYRDAAPLLQRALCLDTDAQARGDRWAMLSTCRFRSGELELLERETELARKEPIGDAALAMLKMNEAARYGAMGQPRLAFDSARAARELAETSGDQATLGFARITETNALILLHRYSEAEECAAKTRAAFEKAGNQVGMARARGISAYLLRLSGKLEQAEAMLREELSNAMTRHLRTATDDLATGYFDVLVAMGRWGRARDVRSTALRHALEDGRTSSVASSMMNLSHLDGLMGATNGLRESVLRAAKLCRLHAPRERPFTLRTRAMELRLKGSLLAAHRIAERAVRSARELGVANEVEWSLVELGRVQTRLDRWDRVERWALAVLAEGSRNGSVADVAFAVLAGRAAVRRGDLSSAREQLSRIDGWRGGPAAYARALSLQLRAEIAIVSGSEDGTTAAQDCLQAFTEIGASPDRATASLEFARLAIDRGSIPAGAMEQWLDDAISDFEKLGDRRGREQAMSIALRWFRSQRSTPAERQRDLLDAVSQLLDSISDLDELTKRAMRLAVREFGAERGLLLLADPVTAELEVRAEYGTIDAATKREAATFSRKAVERALGSGDSVLLGEASKDPQASVSMQKLKLESIVCVPMFHGGRTIGAVYLDDSRRRHAFDASDRQILQGFAQLMATAISSSRGLEEVRRTQEALLDENLSLRQEAADPFLRPEEFVGNSVAMQKVLAIVKRASQLTTTVLITGENGTGKERVARLLHSLGKRKAGPFVAVNCGAIPEGLLESALFGHVRGAFTGADRDHEGKFVQAHHGTLFLDEIGEMPIAHQVRLLSVLENREVHPIGGRNPIHVDVRVVAATNRNLAEMLRDGRFRHDLFHRLLVLPIEIPPLREHKADIPRLAEHFARKFAVLQEREVPELPKDFIAKLMQSDWPGNVRELQNYIERIMALNPERVLRADPLPRDLAQAKSDPLRGSGKGSLAKQLAELERRLLEETLEKADGNQSEAARVLELPEQTLRYRLKKHRLTSARKKSRSRKK